MIECKECGCPYDENMPSCPECGNPTEYSTNTTGSTNCPNCGAPLVNSIACEYCGTVFPKQNNRTNNNSRTDVGVAAFLGGLVGGILSD